MDNIRGGPTTATYALPIQSFRQAAREGVRSKGKRSQGVLRSCQTLHADVRQAVSPAEAEVLTFGIDRLPESDGLVQKAENTTLPILRLLPAQALSTVSSGFASPRPQAPSLMQSSGLHMSPAPTFLLQDVSSGRQGREMRSTGNLVPCLSQEGLF